MKFFKSIIALAALFSVNTLAVPFREQDIADLKEYVYITPTSTLTLKDVEKQLDNDIPGRAKILYAYYGLSLLHKDGKTEEACSSDNVFNKAIKDKDLIDTKTSYYKRVIRHFENEQKYLCAKYQDGQYCEPKIMLVGYDNMYIREVGRICAIGTFNDCEDAELEFFQVLASNGEFDYSNYYSMEEYGLKYKLTVPMDETTDTLLNDCDFKDRDDYLASHPTTTTTTPTPTGLPISTSSKCGNGYGICKNNGCCSKHGWCGTTDEYCDANQGCQSKFGQCHTTAAPPAETELPISTNGKCSKKDGVCGENECCSKYGWCGTTAFHCDVSKGCQSEFGYCNPSSSSSDEDKELPISTNGKCSKKDGKCGKGTCCSKYGWCGSTSVYCDVSQGCQSEFGHCN